LKGACEKFLSFFKNENFSEVGRNFFWFAIFDQKKVWMAQKPWGLENLTLSEVIYGLLIVERSLLLWVEVLDLTSDKHMLGLSHFGIYLPLWTPAVCDGIAILLMCAVLLHYRKAGVQLKVLRYSVAFFYWFAVMSSMTDTYQHHYLMSLVLFIMASYRKETTFNRYDRQSIPALYFFIGNVYFWTAVTKSEPMFLFGGILESLYPELWWLVPPGDPSWMFCSIVAVLLEYYISWKWINGFASGSTLKFIGILFHVILALGPFKVLFFHVYMVAFHFYLA
jgi:hypothetical protein